MSGRQNRTTVGARGRIAQVLAQARASLKEPSRPYTPASLDARTTLDHYVGHSSNTSSSSLDSATSNIHEMVTDSFHSSKLAASGNSSRLSRKELLRQQTQEQMSSEMNLLILDLQDAVLSIETESNISCTDFSRLLSLIRNLTSSIDKFSKYIRNQDSKTSAVPREVEAVCKGLSRVLGRVIDECKSNEARQLACRHILRIQLALLLRCDSSATIPPGTARVLLKTLKAMYELQIKISQTYDTEQRIVSSGNQDEHSTDEGSRSEYGNKADEMLLQGGIDLVLELLGSMWVRISNNFNQDSRENQHMSRPYLDETSESASISNNSSLILLETVMYAAGLIRSYSFLDIHRRRLLVLGTVECIAEGLSSALYYTAHHPDSGTCHSLSSSVGDLEDSLKTSAIQSKAIITQLQHILVQLISAMRNFSLDQNGRLRILGTDALPVICCLLESFKAFPELRLTCVRVTAKLSLLEPFRTQINSQAGQVVALVEIIMTEAEKCRLLMDGEDGDDLPQWPSWYTWPLLSRAAFTLGNLTTSNDSNRKLIGVNCNLIKPLLTILQVCAESLTQLSNFQCEDEEEDGEPDEVDEDEYDDDEDFEHYPGNKTTSSTANTQQQRQSSSGERGDRISGIDHKRSSSRPETSVEEAFRGSDGSTAYDTVKRMPSEASRVDDDGEDEGGEHELTDATVKLLRLLANLCIDQEIGQTIAKKSYGIQVLLELVTCACGRSDQEELLLNVVAACTNITYYACQPRPSSRERDKNGTLLISLALRLSECLFHENEEIVLEAARAMGNLTRRQDVLGSLQTTLADEAFVLLLSHRNSDIVTAVTGALVNQSAEPMCLGPLLETSRPTSALVSVLRRASFKDLALSTLVSQVFHNLLLHGDGLDPTVHQSLKATLDELLECARDFEDDGKYAVFIEVGSLVTGLLAETK